MENQYIKGVRASSNIFRKLGTYLDLKKGLYKNYERIFGITIGSWQKLPRLDYILMFKTLYIKCEGCNPEDFEDEHGSVYQLSLVYNKNRKLIVHESTHKQEIVALAKSLKSFYQINIKDSASDRRNPKWID
ncbi:MAG: hypothetical protein IM600_13190 [Bacteroidetes bacterium]|nr:hypothetical protein [Bacteroidota bacterium]MCA6444379.1 hypothetical protein [Bacteroidota bacterium]